MPTSCAAYGCTEKHSKTCNPSVTFHSFPKEERLREEWIEATGRKDFIPTKHTRLCSKHFRECDMDRTSLSCVRIRTGAVPSIFDVIPKRKSPKKRDGANTIVYTELIGQPGSSITLEKDKPPTEDSKQKTKNARRCDKKETEDQLIKEEVIIADSIYDSSCIYENGVGDFDEDSMGKASPIFHMAPDAVRANAAKKARSSNGTSNQRKKKRPAQDPIDEFDVFGKSVAAQLRKLSVARALRAQTQIQTMLTEERLHDLETTSPPLKPITGDIETSGNGGGSLLVPEPTSISGGLLVQAPPSIDIGSGLLVHQPTSLGDLLVKKSTSTSSVNSIFDKNSNFGEADTHFDELKPSQVTEIHFKPECDVITLDEDDPFEGH